MVDWHPEAKAIQDKLELNLLQIMQYHTKGNDKVNRELLDQIRNAIAGAVWKEEQRATEASREYRVGTAEYDHFAARGIGLQRARDIITGF